MRKKGLYTFVGIACLLFQQQLQGNTDDKQYQLIESDFPLITDHIDNTSDWIKSEVGVKKDSFLDIGAGPGFISKKLIDQFDYGFLLDTNPYYESAYLDLKKDYNLDYAIGSFQQTRFSQQFDIVLCLHVLYHIPRSLWGDIINKAYSLLKPGGKLLIAIADTKGASHQLRSNIREQYANSSVLIELLTALNLPFEKKVIANTYMHKTFKDMFDLTRLFTVADCFLPKEFEELPFEKKVAIDHRIEGFVYGCYDENKQAYSFTDFDAHFVIKKQP